MSSQFYLYLSAPGARTVSEAKLTRYLHCPVDHGQWQFEHRSDDEFTGEDSWSEMIAAEYGVRTDWQMKFTPNKCDIHGSNLRLMEIVNCLLKAFDGDVLLLSGLDLQMLRRIAGTITIENRECAWDKLMLSLCQASRRFSMSWTIGYGEGCQGGNKKGAGLPECIAVLEEVIQKSGTFKLSLLDAPEIGPQELFVEIENGNAVIGLGEDDGEDYIVRSYTNPAAAEDKIEILGNLWDGKMVCHSKEEIISIVEVFFENGDVPREILS